MSASVPLKASEVKRPTPCGTSWRLDGVKRAAQVGVPSTSTQLLPLPQAGAQPVATVAHTGTASTVTHWPWHASQGGGGRSAQLTTLTVQSAVPAGLGELAFASFSAV